MASPLTLLTFVLTLAALSTVQGNALPSRRAFPEGYSYIVNGSRVILLLPGFEGLRPRTGLPTHRHGHALHPFLSEDGDRLPTDQPGLRKKQLGLPKDQFTPLNDQFTPINRFSLPRNQHVPPKEIFSLHKDRFRLPHEQFGEPNDQIGEPRDQFSLLNDQTSLPKDPVNLPHQFTVPKGRFPSKHQSLPQYQVDQPKGLSLQQRKFRDIKCPYRVFALCDNCAIRNPQYFRLVHKSCCGQKGFIRLLCKFGVIF